MPHIVVVGSLNMDLVIRAAALPAPGETVRGEPFHTFPGGKGANQAVAAARLGADVAMIGRVGTDSFGRELKEILQSSGADLSMVEDTTGVATGTAIITVDPQGQNTIVISAGANGALTPEDMDRLGEVIGRARVLLLQLEIPLETVAAAVDLAASKGVRVILNPAPYHDLPPSLLQKLDCLIPNDVEAGYLSGIRVDGLESAKRAAKRIMELGVRSVVVTLGRNGALWADGESLVHVPAYKVEALDETAAGDAFIGCLAAGLVGLKAFPQALKTAAACGALTATKLGAQSSLPSREELNRFLKSRGEPGDLFL